MDCDEKKIWKTAVYVRLSHEDGNKAENESIKNQIDLTRAYLSDKPYLQEIDVYEDYGFSGVNLDRPAFQRMMDDVRSGKITCIICKDLSRLGRNYIETGRLLEGLFPFMGVRCIAVNDNYDSAKQNSQADSLIVPFKNLINDAFLADTSRKIRTQLDVKRRKGDFIGAFSAFGYKKNPENHNQLLIDESAAQTVRDIFRWKIEGMSPQSIANKLNESGTPSPLEHKKSTGCNFSTPFSEQGRSKWTAVSVTRVLTNEIYTGMLTQGVYTTPNYKVKNRVKKSEEEWVRVQQAHEAIISEDDFTLVASLMKRDTRAATGKSTVYLFSGMLFCADCGQNLVRKNAWSKNKKYIYHICSTYKNLKTCKSHSIGESVLYNAVLTSVQHHLQTCLSVEKILRHIENLPVRQIDIQRIQQQIESKQTELDKIARRKIKLYEDLSDEIITKNEYTELKNSFERQKENVENSLAEMTKDLENTLSHGTQQSRWIRHFQKYSEITELTRPLIVDLIDRITVYEHGKIEICYRFQSEFDGTMRYLESLPDGIIPEEAVI